MPSEPLTYLEEARIDGRGAPAWARFRYEDLAHDAAIPIPFLPLDTNRLPEEEGREGLLRLLAEGLFLLRRVDGGEPNLLLPLRAIEHGDGIPIRYADHLSQERIGPEMRGEGEEKAPDREREASRSRALRSTAWCGVPLAPRRNLMESVHITSPENLYRRVTAEIIRAIEAGSGEQYQMPWHRNTASGFPKNAFTSHPYHGINTLALWAAELIHGHPTPWWATYRQWQELGAQVRRGEKATPILFFKKLDVKEEEDHSETSSEKPRIVVRASAVFNADQIDGWEAPGVPVEDKTERIERVEHFIGSVGAAIRYGGDSAYYAKITDHIQMPMRSSFVGTDTSTPTEAYYATLLHEHVHWSGHPARLGRDLSGRFGEDAYAMEELVAELGAAFLCAELRITDAPRKDHALYMRSWLPALKEKPSALAIAASSAMKACRYLGEVSAASVKAA